jgi:hypothetical protein
VVTDEQLIQRVRDALKSETELINPPPDLRARIHRELLQAPEDKRPPRRRTIGVAFGALSFAVTAAVVAIALTLVRHHQTAVPIRTTDAVSAVSSTAARLPIGAPAGPKRVSPNSFQGAAIPSTVRLVAETPDPHGGLPWGLREFQTTRAQTCLQVGRVQDGTIGVIGQDGAWANDHRFHPISPNAYTGDQCSATDANGHAFDNVSDYGAIASSDVQWGAGLQGEGCGGRNGASPEPPCPRADLRNVQYGLLGPEAAGITFIGAGGRLFTEPTNGPDGAYLIVQSATAPPCVLLANGGRGCGGGGETSGPELEAGVITAVNYRDGHTCHLPSPTPAGVPQVSCPLVGYTTAHVNHVSPGQVAAPITVRKLPAKHYCTNGPLGLAPCKTGQTPLRGEHGLLLVEITFTARVAVTNADSHYEYYDSYPSSGRKGCTLGGSSDMTLANIRAGQRVTFQDQIPLACAGVVHGAVTYVPNGGPGGIESGPSPGEAAGSIIVGRFSAAIP